MRRVGQVMRRLKRPPCKVRALTDCSPTSSPRTQSADVHGDGAGVRTAAAAGVFSRLRLGSRCPSCEVATRHSNPRHPRASRSRYRRDVSEVVLPTPRNLVRRTLIGRAECEEAASSKWPYGWQDWQAQVLMLGKDILVLPRAYHVIKIGGWRLGADNHTNDRNGAACGVPRMPAPRSTRESATAEAYPPRLRSEVQHLAVSGSEAC